MTDSSNKKSEINRVMIASRQAPLKEARQAPLKTPPPNPPTTNKATNTDSK